MTKNTIKTIYQQLADDLTVENGIPPRRRHTIVVGMGGSRLGADLIHAWNPSLPLITHHDYGLPELPEETLQESLIIASSYSGNTEETISAFDAAVEQNRAVAAVTVGGELLERAKKQSVPYVQIPDTGIQPREAIGFSVIALLTLMEKQDALKELRDLAHGDTEIYRAEATQIADYLAEKIPVIYASTRNATLAENWKIRLNETAKEPSFWNVFPELNHNELIGFESHNASGAPRRAFAFLFLKDEDDHPRIHRRMEIMQTLLNEWRYPVKIVTLAGETRWEKLLSTIVLADWTTLQLAERSGLDAEQVDAVERFKKLLG
jgi:glucose/mannose-6-phosphate isomerase